ncbi:MAG: flagellar biosynthesis protein FlhB [Caulobacteraceae bacterium]
MSEDTPEKESKTQEPTAKRLQTAREEGNVVNSPEVSALFALGGAMAVILTMGGNMARGIAQALLPFLSHPDAIDLSSHGALDVMHMAMMAAAPVAMVMFAAAFGGAAGNMIQHGILFIPNKLAPDFTKLNPFSGMGRVFGMDSLVNFLKTFIRFFITGITLWLVMRPKANLIQAMAALDPAAILPLTADLLRTAVIATLMLMTLSAGVDWFVRRQQFMAKMRMTREEVKREHKESEGDPHLKGKQKQIRYMRAKRRITEAVPKATVIITNPTHYAVALRYVQGETAAPLCVAKGADHMAMKIREIATENNIPIIEDPPLARALYAKVEMDEAIPREHYAAVAKIVGFVLGAANRRARPAKRAPRPALL